MGVGHFVLMYIRQRKWLIMLTYKVFQMCEIHCEVRCLMIIAYDVTNNGIQ